MLLRLLLVAALAGCLATPVSAQGTYGGIGAALSHFEAQTPHGSGTPPAGAASYWIDAPRSGRVAAYHVVLGPQAKLSTAELKRLVTAGELPADAHQIKGWKHLMGGEPGFCAVYVSRWLGRVLYGRYVIVGVSARDQTASAWVSTAPFCRG